MNIVLGIFIFFTILKQDSIYISGEFENILTRVICPYELN